MYDVIDLCLMTINFVCVCAISLADDCCVDDDYDDDDDDTITRIHTQRWMRARERRIILINLCSEKMCAILNVYIHIRREKMRSWVTRVGLLLIIYMCSRVHKT